MSAYDYTSQTEEALWEQLTRQDNERSRYENVASPDLALAIDDLVRRAPNATADLVMPAATAVLNGVMSREEAYEMLNGATVAAIETVQPPEDNRSWFNKVKDAGYEQLKSGAKWTFALAEFVPQAVQNLGSRVYGAFADETDVYKESEKGFFDGFVASTDFGTLLTGVESGNGFFIGEAAAEQQRQAAMEYRGTIGDEGWTLGRGFALSFSQPGSRVYNIASGLVDAVAALGTPSIPGAKLISKGATGAGNLLGLRTTAGLTNFANAHINPEKVTRWLDSNSGREVVNAMVKVRTIEDAAAMFPKTDAKFWQDVVETDTVDGMRDLLRGDLGLPKPVGTVTDPMTSGGLGTRRGLQSTEDIQVGRGATLRQAVIKRTPLSRLAAPVPGREMIIVSDDIQDITATIRNARDYLITAKVARETVDGVLGRDDILKKLTEALIPSDGVPKVREALDLFDQAMVKSLAKKRILGRNITKAMGRGVDEETGEEFYSTVFQRYREEIRDFDLHGEIDNAGDPVHLVDWDITEEGVVGKVRGNMVEPTAHLSTEMKRWGYFMPDPRRVRRAASEYAWLFTKNPAGGYEWGDPRALTSILDHIQNKVWRPMTLLTGGYIFRNMIESVVRQTMTRGIKSGPTHPLEWVQTVLYRKFAGDVNGDEFAANASRALRRGQKDYAEANNKVMRESLDPLRLEEAAYRSGYYSLARKRKADPLRSSQQYVRGVGNELRLLAGDELARRIASGNYEILDLPASRARRLEEARLSKELGAAPNIDDGTIEWWLKNTEDGKKYLRQAQVRWTNKRMVDEDGREFVGSVKFMDETDPNNIIFDDDNINRLINSVSKRVKSKTGDIESLKQVVANAYDGGKFYAPDGRELFAFDRAGVDAFDDWEVYEYTNDLRSEIRRILADPELAVRLPDTVKFTQPINSISGAAGRSKATWWRRTTDHFFSSVYGKKESFLNRSPVFRQFYYKRINDLVGRTSKEGAEAMVKNITAAYRRTAEDNVKALKRLKTNANGKYEWNGKELSKSAYQRRLRDAEKELASRTADKLDGWAANYVGSRQLWDELKTRAVSGPAEGLFETQIDMLAKGFALEETKRAFYNASETSNFADILRIAVPFGPAWGESMRLWRKNVLTKPNRIKNFGASVQGFRDMDPDGDGRGFVTEDPITGEKVFNYPFAEDLLPFIGGIAGGLLTETLMGPRFKGPVAFGAGAVAGFGASMFAKERLEDQLGTVKPFLQAPLKSFNMSLQGLPGFGPVVQIAAGQLLQNKPKYDDVLEVISPYGVRSVSDAFIPAWAKKISQAITANPESDRMYGDLVIDAYKALGATGEFDPNNQESLQTQRERAESIATWLLIFRGLSQFTGPTRPAVGFDVPVEYSGVEITDEDLRGLAEEGYIPNNLLANEFRRMQQEDYGSAVLNFINTFGTDTMLYVRGRTETVGEGLDASEVFGDWERDNERIADKYPTVFGYFAPTGSEFDLQTYLRQIETGKRRRVTDPQELQRDAEAVIGRALYMAAVRQFPNNPNDIDEANLREYRQALENRLPGFKYQVIELGEREKTIGELLDPTVGPTGQPLGAAYDPDLDGNPVAEGLRAYGEYRQQALDEAARRNNGRYTKSALARKDSADLRQWLRTIGERIGNRYPEFDRVWNRVLFDEVDALPEEGNG